jgi:hypothetical protein
MSESMTPDDRQFFNDVIERLDHISARTDTIAQRAEQGFEHAAKAFENSARAFENSTKARTGTRILTVAVIATVIAVCVAGWAAWRSSSAATQAQTTADTANKLAAQIQVIIDQQDTDRKMSALAACQLRNSAQEAGRQGVALALNNFITEIAKELPNSLDVIERIRANTFEGLPTFVGIDTDCNLDGVYTSADYATIAPVFADGPVEVPSTAPQIETIPPTIQPGG